ncbi:hypothetical protein GCM10011369_23240 [Neiella marina]|uniref:RNA polymerase sigma factor 70 region 4 type 2 domain-containing protein n=1 Tax=Neiella marina TaxID=508461 RepID=A0A8J2U654_9GAMM|nr:helix-turn-helix domain-containing protein [Neiella marina]GGA80651.1 hypothetical protein GCM10011369_23240 [Neiella marina]
MQTTRTETGYRLEELEVDAKPHSRIPTQQARTLLYIAFGLSQKEIAREMGVSKSAVAQACNNLYYTFRTHSMRQTVHQAMKQGVLRYALVLMLCVISVGNHDMERSYRNVRTQRTSRLTRARRLRELQLDLITA